MSDLLPGDLAIMTLSSMHASFGDDPFRLGSYGTDIIYLDRRSPLVTVIHIVPTPGTEYAKVLVMTSGGVLGWVWDGRLDKVNV